MVSKRLDPHTFLSLAWLVVAALIAGSTGTSAQETHTTQLTILVRDTSGTPLGGVHVLVIPDVQGGTMPAMTMGNEHQITDATGRAAWQDLPWGNYVVQFDTMVTLADGRPIEPVAKQNRATDDAACSPLPGFCLRVAEVTAYTARFVIGGTTVADHTVPATPFWDLAAKDTDRVRPFAPILGKEITVAEAAQQGGTFEITTSPPTLAMAGQTQRAAAAKEQGARLLWLIGGAVLLELVVAGGLIWWERAHPEAESSELAQP
ncbi:MAG: carboxypeptidase regulatory-like domain-containing protein [Herpetosiphonaceae bacterium]|nr:carboxypeptidase regulatory-like domain-containing protein [Herpetosiphonaceae bacterium]